MKGAVYPSLKVGDRVKIGPTNGGHSHDREYGLFPGNTGTIVEVYAPGKYAVTLDNAMKGYEGPRRGWTFFAEELERAGIAVNQSDEE